MATLNKIMVIGNLGGDPEMRYTPQGTPVTNFSVAVNRVYTDANGERHEETEWFRVSAWRQLAEQCNLYLAKGRKAYVEGRFRGRTWQGADGQPRFSSEIIADRVLFLDRAGTGPARGDAPFDDETVDPEELPF